MGNDGAECVRLLSLLQPNGFAFLNPFISHCLHEYAPFFWQQCQQLLGNYFPVKAATYSYANTSRTVNREAFQAGRKLAMAARKATMKNQVITPVEEKV